MHEGSSEGHDFSEPFCVFSVSTGSFRIQANIEGQFAASSSRICPCWGNFFIYNISCLSHCSTTSCGKLCMAVQFASHEWCLSQVPCQPLRRNSKMFVSHGILQGSPGSKGREFEVESDSITFPARWLRQTQGVASRFCCRAVATQELSLREGCEWMAPWLASLSGRWIEYDSDIVLIVARGVCIGSFQHHVSESCMRNGTRRSLY